MKIFTRYKKIGKNRHSSASACTDVNQIIVYNIFEIARRRVGPQTKRRFPTQSVSDDRFLNFNDCGRAHRGPVCSFLVF